MLISSIQHLYHCNISQTQYLFQRLNLEHTNIYKYIWIHVIDIWYEKQCKLSCVIQYQYSVSVNLPQISINTNTTLLGSSSSVTMTPMETTSHIISKSTMTADTTSGREKLLKNFIYSAFMSKYPSWHMKIIDRYVKDIWIYMNTCCRYIWYENNAKYTFL